MCRVIMSKYAIVQVGNHQFKATPGEIVTIEKLDGEVGSEVKFNHVLAVSDGATLKTGEGLKSTVTGEIRAQVKAKKIVVFKRKRRQGYKKKQGHRQNYTQVEIKTIEG
ncbi:MAG TPA: 50S ribosomal protein L21 [Oligoflexia bacterium]|nr:50S ribosomal protein L21 [Oligoflexia bacterium]HMR24517.1 50S ribosomal protein L21 [Oligoflexia bacterium]